MIFWFSRERCWGGGVYLLYFCLKIEVEIRPMEYSISLVFFQLIQDGDGKRVTLRIKLESKQLESKTKLKSHLLIESLSECQNAIGRKKFRSKLTSNS